MKSFSRYGTGVLVLLAVIATGCSSGGKGASGPTTAAATTTSIHVSGDAAVAKAALLTLHDLPSGWTAKPHAPTDQSEAALDARIAACMHVNLKLVDTGRQPHADSQDFTGPAGQQISSGVALFPSPALPAQWIKLYSKPATLACLAKNIGNPVDPPRPSILTLRPIGDGVIAVRLTASALVADALFARRGRALAYISVIDPKGVDESALLAASIGRLPKSA